MPYKLQLLLSSIYSNEKYFQHMVYKTLAEELTDTLCV